MDFFVTCTMSWMVVSTKHVKTTLGFLIVLLITPRAAGQEEILSPPKNVTAFVGDYVEMYCHVRFAEDVLTWEFNDLAVYHYQYEEEKYPNKADQKYGLWVKHEGNQFILTVKNTSYASAGMYKCKMTTAFALAHLIILDTPHMTSQQEGATAKYTCEASFAGPNQHNIDPDQYPKLRMLLGGHLLHVHALEQQPNTSANFRILTTVYRTAVEDNVVGKRLKCEIMTDNPKVVASTHVIIRPFLSSGTTIQTEASQAEDSNGAVQAGVAFAVINFVLIVGIIVGVIAYKFVLKNNPHFQKMIGKYQAVKQNEDKDSDTEAPPPLGTKEKVQSAKGTQKPKKDKTTKSSKKGATKGNKKESTEDTTTNPTMQFEPAKPSKTPHGTDIELQDVGTNELVKSPEKPPLKQHPDQHESLQDSQPQPSQTQLPPQKPPHLEQPSQPPSSTPQTQNLTGRNLEEQPQNAGSSQEMAAKEGAGQAARKELEGQPESTYKYHNEQTENTSAEEKLTSTQKAAKKASEAVKAAKTAEQKANEAKEAVKKKRISLKKVSEEDLKENAKKAVQKAKEAQDAADKAEQKLGDANAFVRNAEMEFNNAKEEVKNAASKADKKNKEKMAKDIENDLSAVQKTVHKATKFVNTAKDTANDAAKNAAEKAKEVGVALTYV